MAWVVSSLWFIGISWIVVGFAYVGLIFFVIWRRDRNPRWTVVKKLFAMHRYQEKFFVKYPGMREKAREELYTSTLPRRPF